MGNVDLQWHAENPALQASEKYELKLTALQAIGNMGFDFLTTDAQSYSGCLGIKNISFKPTKAQLIHAYLSFKKTRPDLWLF